MLSSLRDARSGFMSRHLVETVHQLHHAFTFQNQQEEILVVRMVIDTHVFRNVLGVNSLTVHCRGCVLTLEWVVRRILETTYHRSPIMILVCLEPLLHRVERV